MQEYFAKVQEIQQETDQGTQQVQSATDEKMAVATTDAEGLSVFKDGLESQLEVLEGAASDLGALKPPGEVAEAHERFVQGLDDTIVALEEGIAKFSGYTSMPQAAEALVSPRLQAAGTEVDEACSDLVAIAADNQIETTLTCRGGAESGGPTDAPPAPGPQSEPTT